jgi:NAD(P)-dependent dehydrogenase (short-subunit alcohol dehydrogenase family)
MMENRVAVITGAATGIGRACAKLFVEEGYAVSLLDNNSEELEKTCEAIGKDSEGLLSLICDVADEGDVKRSIARTVEAFGRIDVLVNNAGIVLVRPFDEIELDDFNRVMQVNLGGNFLLCKYVLPVMKQQRAGAIVNMASVSGHVGQTEHVVYGATKGGILALTRALAWEVSPWGIRVNSISPGSVDTPMLRSDIQLESDRLGIPFDEVKREREKEQAFDRWADPKEIAETVLFLASDKASFVTGTDLLVDCGWVAK